MSALVAYLLHHAALAAHGVDRDGVASDTKQIKHNSYRRDLFEFLSHFFLRQHQKQIGGTGTDLVNDRPPQAICSLSLL